MIGLGKSAGDVTEAQLLVVVFAMIDEGVGRICLVDSRRAGFQSLFDVKDVRQDFPIHLDGLYRCPRLRLGLSNNGGDRFTLVCGLGVRKQRFVIQPEIKKRQERIEVHRHVFAGDDPNDAIHPLGR